MEINNNNNNNNNNNSKLLFTEAKHVDDIFLIGSLSNHDSGTENNFDWKWFYILTTNLVLLLYKMMMITIII